MPAASALVQHLSAALTGLQISDLHPVSSLLDPDLAVYSVVEVAEKRADSSDSTYPALRRDYAVPGEDRPVRRVRFAGFLSRTWIGSIILGAVYSARSSCFIGFDVSASWNAKLVGLGPTCSRITRKPTARCGLAPGFFPGD